MLMIAPTTGHGETQVMKGKIERGLGRVVGSSALQMKGESKVQQGNAEKVAAGHLQDADRLETQAAAKRTMAGVQPGVHSTAGNMRGGVHH
jgi:hypothetical protein